jgi:hypothetical protein
MWQNESIGELGRHLSREVLPIVVVTHRRLRVGMSRMSLGSPHIAVAGVEGYRDARVPEAVGTRHNPRVASKVLDHVVEPLAGHVLAPLVLCSIHDERWLVLARNADTRDKPAVDSPPTSVRSRRSSALRCVIGCNAARRGGLAGKRLA